jgi:hypothetical protein
MLAQSGDVARLKDTIDQIVQNEQARPPAYGAPQRGAIDSLIDGIANDICTKIAALREKLDGIEQQALIEAARQKHALNEHVALCAALADEVAHVRESIVRLERREP